MFDIYSSNTYEPPLNMSAFLGRRKYYSKINKEKMNDIDKMNEFSLSEQSSNWDNLEISIETAVQKLNPGNIRLTSTKLFELNIIRGKGLLCRSIMKAQSSSLEFTHIYAMLVSFINCQFPNIAELLLIRCVCLFTNAYKCKEEYKCVPPVIFIAHLVHNNVAKDCLVLDILKMLIKTPNLHSIGMVDKILNICGKKLNSNPQNENDLKYLFDTLQNISQDGQIDESVQCLVKSILLTYQNHLEDEQRFDLVAPHKQFTHSLTLNEKYNPQYELDSFVFDLDFKSNEIIFKTNAKQILKEKCKVYYFSNYDFDENMADDEDDEVDLCVAYLDCCFENCTVYNKFFTDIIQNLCLLNPSIVGALEFIFRRCVPVLHTTKPNRIISLAYFFAQLLSLDIISWKIFSSVHLTEIEKSYCGRVFLKAMFNELILQMGNNGLQRRILDP
ncbi:hypothetical protein ACI65C_005889 [Semiaphis heraclei]